MRLFKVTTLIVIFALLSNYCYSQVVSNGDTFSVNVPVKNNGPSVDFNVESKITIPEGISLLSTDPSVGVYVESDSTWEIGTLSPGITQNIILNFEVTDISQFPVVVEANSSGVRNDSNLSNNVYRDTINTVMSLLSGQAKNFSYAGIRGNVLDNDTLCNYCSTKVYLDTGTEVNGEVIYLNETTGEYRFVFEDATEDGYFSYNLVCYDCGDGLEYYQGTATEVIPKLFTDSLFGGGGGIESCCPDTFAQNLFVEEIDTTTKKIIIPLSSGDTLEAMFTDYRGSAGTGDDWGSQTVQSDASLSGNGTAGSPLEVNFPYLDTSTTNELQTLITSSTSNSMTLLLSPMGDSIVFQEGAGINLATSGKVTDIINIAPFPGFTTVFGDYGENAESTTVTDGETIDFTLSSFDITGEVILDPSPSNILSSSASGLLAEAADTSNINEAQSLNPTDVGGDPAAQLTQVDGNGGGTIVFEGGTQTEVTRSGSIYTFNNLAPFPGFTDLDTDYGVDISLYSTLQDLTDTATNIRQALLDTATSIRNDELHAEQILTEELTDSTRQIKIVLNNGDTVQTEMSINPPAPEVANYYTLDMTVTPTGDTVGTNTEFDVGVVSTPNNGTFTSTIEMAIPKDAVVTDWAVHVDSTISSGSPSNAKVLLIYNPFDGSSSGTMSSVNDPDFNKNLKLSGSGYPVIAGGSITARVQTQNTYIVGLHVSVTLLMDGSETNTVTVTNNYTPVP